MIIKDSMSMIKGKGLYRYKSKSQRIRDNQLKPNIIDKKSFDFGDFTLLAGLGALCYLIAITLGSRSYTDLMPEGLGKTITLILFVILAFLSTGYSVYLSEYVALKLGLRKARTYELPRLRNFRLIFLVIAVVLFGLAFSIYLDYNFFRVNNQPIRTEIAIALAILSGVLATVSLMTHMIYEMFKDGWRSYAFSFLFLFVAGLIWLNAFRDAEKEAYVTDNQYCYWLRSSFDIDISPDKKDRLFKGDSIQMTNQQGAYYSNPACSSKIRNGLNHTAFRVTQ